MRLSCLPEQLVRSSEQLVLMDIKRVLLGPDVMLEDLLANQTAAKGVVTIVYQKLVSQNGGSFGGVGAIRLLAM